MAATCGNGSPAVDLMGKSLTPHQVSKALTLGDLWAGDRCAFSTEPVPAHLHVFPLLSSEWQNQGLWHQLLFTVRRDTGKKCPPSLPQASLPTSKGLETRDFPGGPGVKTLRFHCRGCRLDP